MSPVGLLLTNKRVEAGDSSGGRSGPVDFSHERKQDTMDTTLTIQDTPLVPSPDHEDAANALARVEPELALVDPRDFVRISIDIPRATRTALGALAALRALRPQIATLPGIAMDKIDKIEDYALAAWY